MRELYNSVPISHQLIATQIAAVFALARMAKDASEKGAAAGEAAKGARSDDGAPTGGEAPATGGVTAAATGGDTSTTATGGATTAATGARARGALTAVVGASVTVVTAKVGNNVGAAVG